MIAEIVTIGTELLLGEIVDSNAAHIARQLAAIGVDHLYTTTVGDNEQRITQTIRDAFKRSDVVITTGGLGPTVDDMTRQAVAAATDRELVYLPDLMAKIEARFAHRGHPMSANNRRQAYVPAGAIVIENPVGTAPAFVVEVGEKAVLSLPGVPHEMEYLMRERVLPYLSQKMGSGAVILTRMVHTVGIGESTVDQAIGDLMVDRNPTVGTRAHAGQTDVCITAKAASPAEASLLLDAMEKRVRERLGPAVFGVDGETLAGVVVDRLAEKGLTLAVAETTTGGAVARRLQEANGNASVLTGVHIALDTAALARELEAGQGLVGEELAQQMAVGLQRRHEAGVALVVIEGSEAQTQLYVALATPQGSLSKHWPSRGGSEYAIQWATHYALDMVRQWLDS